MKYVCLVYSDESVWETMPKPEVERVQAEYLEFMDSVKRSGHYLGSNPLQPTHTATTVRVRNGKPLMTDGPFARTMEQLGGYFLIEAKDLNDAIQIASRIPAARSGSVEVRPVLEVHGP